MIAYLLNLVFVS